MRKHSATPAKPGPVPLPDGADRDSMIRLTAYGLYEQHGRRDDHALDDWLEAEAIVDAQLLADRTTVHALPSAPNRASHRARAG